MANRVVFLDIDGVLNSTAFFLARREMRGLAGLALTREGDLHDLDGDAIERLNRIVEATGAKIVVCSTWRLIHDIAWLRSHLAGQGLRAEIIDVTPDIPHGTRGNEILKWLDAHPGVSSWVVIDDTPSDLRQVRRNVVVTKFETGLLDEHVQDAIAILGATQPVSLGAP